MKPVALYSESHFINYFKKTHWTPCVWNVCNWTFIYRL